MKHVIRSHVKAEGFGSWLLQSRHRDGGWEGSLWCRITAADRYLRVSGDFAPIIFAYGPNDPRACVAWMGKEQHLSSYAIEKARLGSGRDACTEEDPDGARDDIRCRIAELRKELEGEAELHQDECAEGLTAPDEDDEVAPSLEMDRLEAEITAWQAGLDVLDEYSGREGVFMLCRALHESGAIEAEDLVGIGARPSMALKWAHAAVRRLHELLQAALVCPTCEDVKPGECCGAGSGCGKPIPRSEQELAPDPLASEIHNEHTLHLQCDACLRESCHAI